MKYFSFGGLQFIQLVKLNTMQRTVTVLLTDTHILSMDVLLNGLRISAKKEIQSQCCMMVKRCHFDVIFWLLLVGD